MSETTETPAVHECHRCQHLRHGCAIYDRWARLPAAEFIAWLNAAHCDGFEPRQLAPAKGGAHA